MKKVISILLCLILCLGLLPARAWAADVSEVLDFTTQSTDVSGDGYSWAADSKTLTLTNFTQTISASAQRGIAIALPENTTLVLEGESTVTNSSLGGTCVQYEGNLTVHGEGTLNLNLYMQTSNTCGKGIYEKSDTKTDNILTIKSGTLNVTGKEANTGSNGYIGISGAEVHLDGGTVNMKNITYGVNAYYWWVEARKFLVNGGTFQYGKKNDYTGDLRYAVSSGSNRNNSGFSQVSITSGTVDISGVRNAFSVEHTPVSVTGGSLKIHDLVRQTASSGVVQNTNAFLCGAGSKTEAEPKISLTGGNIEISGCDYILTAVNILGMDMLEVGENIALTGLVRVDQYGIYPENESLGVSQVRVYGDYTLAESISFHEGNSGFWEIGLSEGSTLTIPEGMTFDLSKLVSRGEDFEISGPGDVYDLSGGTIVNNGILALPNVDAEEIPAYIKTLDITGSGRMEVRDRQTDAVLATYTNSGVMLRDPAGVLDLSGAGTDISDAALGYSWDAATKTLTLAEGFNATEVKLPDATVTIVTEGESRIGMLSVGSGPDNAKLTFSGTGPLTVNERINIAGGDGNTITVNENATVIANGGIYIGASGGVNSTITVKGILTAKVGAGATAISAGSVAIGDTGILDISGEGGVQLNGMPELGDNQYKDLFTVTGNGRFTADCSEYNIKVIFTNEGDLPKDEAGNPDAKAVINLGDEYMPDNCEAGLKDNAVNLVRISTGEIYSGALTIHKNHTWETAWTQGETTHWHACEFAGCTGKQPGSEASHFYRSCVCTVCGYQAPAGTPDSSNNSGGSNACTGGTDCPSRAFTDLGGVGSWYHEAVDYVLRNKLMSGYGNGRFGPDNDLSRAQLARILYNAAGKPAVTGDSAFTDVRSDVWYTSAITWAEEQKVAAGYGDGRFGPNDLITREQLAAMLWRYAGRPEVTEEELEFTDAGKISRYAREGLQWAVEQGIVQGKDNGILDPKGKATRAEAAAMLMRFLSR